MTSRPFLFPYLSLAAGVLCLSLSALFIRWSEAPGIVTTLYRMSLATLALAPFLAHRPGIPSGNKAPLGRVWVWFSLAGGILAALDHAAWSTSIGYTRVANATLLNNVAPVWVALVAWLAYKERLRWIFWLGLALAVGGVGFMTGTDLLFSPTLGRGDLLALVSSLFYAGYYLVTQRARQRLSAGKYMLLANAFSALVLLGLCLLMDLPLSGFSGRTYLVFIGAALISQVGGHLSLTYALGHLPVWVVSPTMVAQPLVTALLAVPLLGEPISAIQALGGAAVLAGIYLVNRTAGHPA